MPATPAWPPASLPRLYIDEVLSAAATVQLDGAASNYLGNVLRLQPGARIKLFDNRTGEWLAELTEIGRRRATAVLRDHLKPREPVPDLWLLFAPIKRGRIDWLVEKATELGVARLLPVLTNRTVVDRLNLDRLRAHSVEAAEQCERTALPELAPPVPLATALRDWPAERPLYFADEEGGAPLIDAAERGPSAILIGPEGGFTAEERDTIRALPAARPVSLGPRVLRADTAAIAAVSLWMATGGDWTQSAREAPPSA